MSHVIAGVQMMTRVQTSHPLDPLSAAEISVAVATVRAAGATPEVVHNHKQCFCIPNLKV